MENMTAKQKKNVAKPTPDQIRFCEKLEKRESLNNSRPSTCDQENKDKMRTGSASSPLGMQKIKIKSKFNNSIKNHQHSKSIAMHRVKKLTNSIHVEHNVSISGDQSKKA